MLVTDGKSVGCLASGLFLVLQTTLVAAEDANGVLAVSLTVLTSCVVNVNPSPATNAEVSCPQAYPYRARISSGVMAGMIPNDIDSKPFFTGAQLLDLPQLSTQSIPSNEVSPEVLLLTISY